MNKKIIWTVFVLVIGVGVYFAASFLRTNNPAVVGTPIEKVTYHNSVYGISFSYPKGYVLSEGERGNAERAHYAIVLIAETDAAPPVNGEGPTAITIDIYQNNLDKQSLLGWLKGTAVSNFKLGDGTYVTTTVQGKEAVAYRWSGLYEGETTAFLHKENVIAASVTWLTPEDKIVANYRELISSVRLSE